MSPKKEQINAKSSKPAKAAKNTIMLKVNKSQFTSSDESIPLEKTAEENKWMTNSLFDSDLTKDIKDYIYNLASLINNTVYGTMYTNQDFSKQARQSLQSVSNGMGKSIEQNMQLGREILKCQTASDVIDLQQKFFEVNFTNMVKLYSDLSYSYQNLTTEFRKHSVHLTDKNMKCFIY